MCCALLAAVALVYGQSLSFELVNYDDPGYARDNPNVRAGLTGAGVAWAFRTTEQANWHPLTWLSLMLDASLGGGKPGAFHLTNLLLHALASVLLFLALDRMTRARARSAFVAALFAVHPLHVESVAWVAERKDVLSAPFWFLAMLAHARRAERPGPGSGLLVAGALALGLMAKPMLVTLPFVLLLLDVWPLGRFRLGVDGAPVAARLVREKLPLFALAFASCCVTLLVQHRGGALVMLGVRPLAARVGNALVAYVVYLGKTFWPFDLAVLYPFPRQGPAAGVVAGAAVLLLAVSIAVALAARTRPYLAVGWLWYVGTLVPVIGVVQFGLQAMADRYTYLPLVGVFLVVSWGVPELLERFLPTRPRARSAVLAAGAVLVALSVIAHAQTSSWRDSVALNEQAARVTPGNFVILHNLGEALYREGRIEEAAASWRAALVAEPSYLEARASLAAALYRLGQVDEAVALCEEVLRVDPMHAFARYNLGVIRLHQGRLQEARDDLLVAVQSSPHNVESQVNLGVVLARLGRLDEAVACFEEALRLDPGSEAARRNLERARRPATP